MIQEVFSRYETEVKKADYLFSKVQEKYPLSVKCRIRCCDCCYAIFGVFPIEAAYINYHFNRLERRIRRDVLRRAEKAEADILRVKYKLKVFEDKPNMKVYGLGRERIRCPFLTDKKECIFYDKRPIICRIYGVPFSFKDDKDNRKEKAFVCRFSGFQEKATYPTVKLGDIYNKLYMLSRDLLKEGSSANLQKADYMLPLSRILRMRFEEVMKGEFEEK